MHHFTCLALTRATGVPRIRQMERVDKQAKVKHPLKRVARLWLLLEVKFGYEPA